jgi:endogenous inhibitor of DNA gyrase (YacG/DUF329 family)
MPSPRIVACPQCGRPVEWAATSRFRPFCSARCRTIDLGAWASESYRVPAEDGDEPVLPPPAASGPASSDNPKT